MHVVGRWMAGDRKEGGGLYLTKPGVLMDLSGLKKKEMLVLHAKILKGAWRLTALVCFSRWQMPFCVLHKLTKFACSLYLFQRQPFFAFNGTEELLGTGSLLVGEGGRRDCSRTLGHHDAPHIQMEEGAGAAPSVLIAWGCPGCEQCHRPQTVSCADELPEPPLQCAHAHPVEDRQIHHVLISACLRSADR